MDHKTVPAHTGSDIASVNAAIAQLVHAGGDTTAALAHLRAHRETAGKPRFLEGAEMQEAVRAVAERDKLEESKRQQLLGAIVEHEISERRAVEKTNESQILGDIAPLRERAIGPDGVVNVKLIAPGWGSSGYYSPEVLERDGKKAFTAGTHMFFDHPSPSEERERPEGSLKNLASVLVTDASYAEHGPDGPGLYADAKVFSGYKEALEELAPHIGVSIRGDGKVSEGERDGKRGRIVEQILRGRSVDWVTAAGAGGKAVQLFEAVREGGVMPEEKKTETTSSTDDGKKTETTTTTEAKKDDATTQTTETKTTESKRTEGEQRLLERLAIRDARDVVTEILETKSNVPEPTAKRLKETLPSKATLDADGELDDAAFRKLAEKAIDDEVSYVLEVSGRGRVRDMGNATPVDEKTKAADAETKKALQENLVKLGSSEKAAELALSE